MKWLKHMAASWDDEKLAALVGKGGMEGLARYGLYWRVNEIIASQMDGKTPLCSVRYPVTRWSLLLSLRGSLVFSTLSTLAVTYLVTVERDGSDIIVTNRNLLKYRDEYSRKSGHSPVQEGEGEGEGEIDIAPPLVAAEPERKEPMPEAVLHLPAIGGKNYAVTHEQVDHWRELFPAIDVMQELRAMLAWCEANQRNRKTTSGMARFIVSWLSRSQNHAPKVVSLPKPAGRKYKALDPTPENWLLARVPEVEE